MARNLKALVTKHSFKERYKTAHTYLTKLKFLVEDVSRTASRTQYGFFLMYWCKRIQPSIPRARDTLHAPRMDSISRKGYCRSDSFAHGSTCQYRPSAFPLQPQHALPDMFLWLISNNKRTAYQRIPARDLIYSMVAEECGRDCGKVQTMFLKVRPAVSVCSFVCPSAYLFVCLL